MSNKHRRKLHPSVQATLEREALLKEINPTGAGEDPAVQALLDPKFEQMTNMDAAQIALMLQQIIRGQNSLLARQDETGATIAKILERQDKVDQLLAKNESAERREIEDVLARSSKLKATGDAHDRIVAKGAKQYTQAIQQARASQATDKLYFEQQLKTMPKEEIVSPGVWIQTREGHKLIAEEVRIKHKVWYLPPGQPIVVPKAVADVIRARRQSQAETAKRKEVLGKQVEQTKLAEAWNDIGGAQTMPLA